MDGEHNHQYYLTYFYEFHKPLSTITKRSGTDYLENIKNINVPNSNKQTKKNISYPTSTAPKKFQYFTEICTIVVFYTFYTLIAFGCI